MQGKNKEGGRFIKDIQEVLPANAAELAAHEAYLADLDKAAGADCAWRQWPQS